MDELKKTDANRKSEGRMARSVLTVLTLAVAGAASWEAATRIATEIEARSLTQARAALTAEGQTWARVATDGLAVRISGVAPDEVARFRALSAVSSRIDDRRIDDRMSVAERALLDPPDFSLEMMRQGTALSLIGLVPERTNRDSIAGRLSRGGTQITDLTGTAAFPPPASWAAALDFGLRAAEMLDQGTISVTPGAVRITGNAASAAEKARIETALKAATPEGVTADIAISAPLPVIAPYRLRVSRADGEVRLDSCAAETPEIRTRILAAAIAAGVAPDRADCALGIGAPPGWEQAVLAALNDLGQGTLDILDGTVRITLPADTTDDDLAARGDSLAAALPASFTLNLQRAEAAPDEGPARFTAEIGTGPSATLHGVIPDETMRQTVQSLARAQLGPIEGELRLDPGIPEGWPLRVMAGLDAMGVIDRGKLDVTGQMIAISGVSGDPFATQKAVAALATRLGAGVEYSLAIAYDRHLDPDITQPDGTTCVDRLNQVMLESEIGFEPGGARIAGDIAPVLEQLRPIMDDCAGFQIEIAGHTDSQGRDDFNMALSLERAGAVLAALRAAGLPADHMTAAGYGETRPIAENDTQEGRDANRRIEMTLLSPDPVEAPVPPAPAVTGKTPTAEAATEALLAAINAVPAPDPDIPASLLDTETLASPPKIEPPAVVMDATPDTPRPPFRPADGAASDSGDAPDSTDPDAATPKEAQ